MFTRRCPNFAIILAAAFALSGIAKATSADERPNVIIFFVDDCGYADFGVFGSKDIHTPHIDSLAAEGVLCTNGYVTYSVCSPSRAGMMTGRYQNRFGHVNNLRANVGPGIPEEEILISEMLLDAGYATGIVGKWHLGKADPEDYPRNHGFQEGFFTPHNSGAHDRNCPDIVRYWGEPPWTEPEYKADAYARESVAFIEKHKDEPFFLYVSSDIAHGPRQLLKKWAARASHIQDSERKKQATMLMALDDMVGTILAKLKAEGLYQRTLVLFANDNGAGVKEGVTTRTFNAPFRGGKGSNQYEGGVRVPYLVSWPAGLPAGNVYDQPVSTLDFLPTIAAATGANEPHDRPVDGVNLLPYFRGENPGNPHEELFWRAGKNPDRLVMRMGDWKMHWDRAKDNCELYNLTNDIHEDRDVADQFPEIVRTMRVKLIAWSREIDEECGAERLAAIARQILEVKEANKNDPVKQANKARKKAEKPKRSERKRAPVDAS